MKRQPVIICYIILFLLTIFNATYGHENIIHIKEMESMSYNIFQTTDADLRVSGYLLSDGKKTRLPIGSTLDKKNGIFYWLPGPGFVGEYELLFLSPKQGTEKKIKIVISPKPGPVKIKMKPKNISRVLSSGQPFGDFSTPLNGADVSGSIAVTGWALDDQLVSSVKIKRNAVTGDPAAVIEDDGLVFIGTAIFVTGARPDVEAAYSNYPNNDKAGWGYMLLTNMLPNGGNGTFELTAIATDGDNNTTVLGKKSVTIDNANAVKPFGAIETPAQGGTVSGNSFTNWGWALTPAPNSIPTDGSTISVIIDGLSPGNPTYNIYREDVAGLFPGYANSGGAFGYLNIDVSDYENGLHTIHWTVSDNAGNTDGIGSRYFSISNSGPTPQRRVPAEWETHAATWMQWPGQWEVNMRPAFADIINVVQDYEPLHLLTGSESEKNQARQFLAGRGVSETNITWHIIAVDNSWMRDNGPIYVTDGTETWIQNWKFDAWGGNFGTEVRFENDNRVPAKVGEYLGITVEDRQDYVMEKGNLEFNGDNILVVNWDCQDDRNPGKTEAQHETILTEAFGVTRIIWAYGHDSQDGTTGHIDGTARFIDSDTIVVVDYGEATDRNLAAACEAAGLEVLRYPGDPNWLVGNGFVAGMGDGTANDDALKARIEIFFPNRDVYMIDARTIAESGGGIHCVTNDQPVLH
ncbi:MAG: agmatine deiminase family protein [bacterium]|nr:agmatine deiminase family protein [bacterium]